MLKGQLALTAVRPTAPVTGTTTPPTGGDLAAGRPVNASSTNGAYVAANAVDASTSSYWESSGALPQWLQVDLGAATTVGRFVLRLLPAWGSRTQTLAITASTNGSTFTTLAASATRTFDPATGNTVTVPCTPTQARYVRLTVTANTAWPAAQLSTLEAYPS